MTKVLVGTTDGLHELGGSEGVQIAGHEVNSLARDASDWWAIVDEREVWRSSDGNPWARHASVQDLRANCLLSTKATLLVGTSESHLLAVREDSLERVESFDQTPGRDEWYTPWGGPPDVRSMSADVSGSVYVNVHVGGVVRSSDGGGTWAPTLDIHSDVHEVLLDPASGLVLAASARGLGVSRDGGDSWAFSIEGLHGNYLRAVAVVDSTVLVSASTGPRTNRAALYRKPLEGDVDFKKCQAGLPEWFSDNINTLCLAASAQTAAFGTSEGAVYISLDSGQTWTLEADSLPPVRCVALE